MAAGGSWASGTASNTGMCANIIGVEINSPYTGSRLMITDMK